MVLRQAQAQARAVARGAFTLMEVLVVVAILVVLAGVGGVVYIKYLDKAKEDAARTQIKVLDEAVMAHNGLAWIKSTCPLAEFRDGQAAIAHATRACELAGWKDSDFIDTLACAYAEAGQFDQAIHWQSKICQEAPDNQDFASRLKLYQEGKPYRNDPTA